MLFGGRVARQPYYSSGGVVKLTEVSAEEELENLNCWSLEPRSVSTESLRAAPVCINR